ncbi:MAG: hypothetical protein ACOCV1_06350 [Bacillota bacterium]
MTHIQTKGPLKFHTTYSEYDSYPENQISGKYVFITDTQTIITNSKNNDEVVGFFTTRYFDFERMAELGFKGEEYFLFDIKDSTIWLYNAISKFHSVQGLLGAETEFKDGIFGSRENLLLLERIYIVPKYRGKKIASRIIYNLAKIMEIEVGEAGAVAVDLMPFEMNKALTKERIIDKHSKKRKLYRLFTRCGYKLTPDTKYSEWGYFMYQNTDLVYNKEKTA